MPDTTCRPFRGCSAVLLRPSRVEVFSNYSLISRVGRVAARLRSCPGLFFLVLGLGILTVSSSPAAAKASPQRFQYSLPRMGTIFRIEMYATSDAEASSAAEAAFARAEELEQIMSDYRADSELMRLMRHGATAPFPVSSDLYSVLAKSLWASKLSQGAFDISIGPLADLWRSARKSGRLPDAGEIAKAKALVDYRNIELDPVHHTVFLKRAGMKLDLGAIGKGYAADQMLAVLQSQGIHQALVVAGGEVVTGGPPPGSSGWKVRIDTADSDAGVAPCTLLLSAHAVSTSGDEHQFLEVNGHRYSHIINPRTGWALEGKSSTTVIARDSTTADTLATAFSTMSVSDGIRVAQSLPGVSALWVRRVGGNWRYSTSRGFPTSCHGLPERSK
jgi:thiamine biosynthesis lipoprotein